MIKIKRRLDFLLKHNKQLLEDTENIFTNFVDVYLYDNDELEASIALIKITLYSKIGKPSNICKYGGKRQVAN